MRVVAVVVAGSAHALTPVAGVPMVVCAVRSVLAGVPVERVTVVTAAALRPAVEHVCAGERVDVRDNAGNDDPVTEGVGDVVLLHDACRPLAPGDLAAAVVEAVRAGHGMAVPAMRLTDTVKSVDDRGSVTGTPDRAALRVLQTPIALRARLLPADVGGDPLTVIRRHAAAGGGVHTVPGHPAAFAVRSAWDLELAELIADGRIRL